MMESDNFWHRKTFESVMNDLWNMWAEEIQELENAHMHSTNNDEYNNEMDGVEVNDLCSVSQSKNDTFSEGKESAKEESQDKSKHNETDKMEDEFKTMRSESMIKKESRICNDVLGAHKKFLERRDSRRTRECGEEPTEKTEKQKHEEEYVRPTLDTGS